MARIGYARVSTLDQDLKTQFAKLKVEGCDIVRAEKVSGSKVVPIRSATMVIVLIGCVLSKVQKPKPPERGILPTGEWVWRVIHGLSRRSSRLL